MVLGPDASPPYGPTALRPYGPSDTSLQGASSSPNLVLATGESLDWLFR